MRIKFLLGSVLSLMISLTTVAKNNPGVDLLKLGQLDLAKQYFMKAMRQAPADSFYYLGEIALAEGNEAEAKANYEKAMNSNPESPYSQIGVAKAKLKSDDKEAKKELEGLVKKNKKDVFVILEVAKAFYDNNMIKEGDKAILDAKKADKNSPYIYIYEGDRVMQSDPATKAGDAAMQYDQAINFDDKCVLAYIKGAQVYEHINYKTAIKQYKTALEIDPTNSLVHKFLGRVYASNGYSPEAIAIYREYFDKNAYDIEDISNYSRALYFNKDYDTAIKILKEGIEKDPENFVMHRLLMYSNNELKAYEEGVTIGDKFITLRSDTGYLAQDYIIYGNLLNEVDRQADAFTQYNKAIELDPSKVELYKELAITCGKDKMYAEAVNMQLKYLELAGEDVIEASDYYQLGSYYQSQGRALMSETDADKIAEREALLKKADEAFTVVTERLPENYLGYYMRASANSLLDPELKVGLAKPFYEKTIEILTANNELETRKNIVLTAYEYLAVYHYFDFAGNKNREAKDMAKEYSEKYREINPDKESINSILEEIQ